MALIGANNEEKIWNYLKAKGLNDYGIAGCMGNLYAESALRPNNLQNTYEKKLGYTDDEYISAVDSGKYANFVKDSAGFGLAQWTYWSRKQNLLNFAKAKNKSIGDLEMQLDFLWKELSESYKSVLNTLRSAKSVLEASNDMLLKFERPANQGASVQKKRAEYGQKYYDKYASQSAQKPAGATQSSHAGNSSTKPQSGSTGKSELSVGDIVKFKGTTHYVSSNSVKGVSCKPGEAKVTVIAKNAKHPYHLQKTAGSSSTVYGWVDAADIEGVTAETTQTTTSSSSDFKKRTTAPSALDKHWIHTSNGGLNECIEINNSGSCLPNCVGYAWGRFYEITSRRPALSRANAENWWGYTADGYKRSQTPVEGAVICWRKGRAGYGNDGAGHVAIVEEVKSNGDVLTSNSAYGGTRFYMQTVTKASGYSIGSAYTFQGFILPPAVTASKPTNTTTIPTTNTPTGGTGMKYNSSNKPLVCMMTQSTCYKGTSKMKPVGVLWHSTGANNPNLKRYVQPDDNASNRAELLALIGTNSYKNDWNHITRQAGLNCWIGKLADGTVTTIQTMPWDYKPWGCGSGSKGSCNNGWIQFEICEDGLTDSTYFNKVYKEACEITAYLCDLYDIDPNGYTTLNGVKVPNILCHADSCALGLGSNHGDVNHWFPKHGKSMATARADVAKLMGSSTVSGSTTKPETSTTTTTQVSSGVKVGDVVKIASNATYYNGKTIPSWVKNKNWIVSSVSGDRAVIDKSEDGKNAICSPINTKYLTVANAASTETVFESYRVKVTADALNIRKGAGTNYAIAGTIKNKGVYTIVAESDGKGANKWGKLKSGAGWISLDYTDKV